MKNNILFILLLACGFALTSCSSPVIATVDGTKITASDVKNAVEIEKLKFDPIILKTETNRTAFKKAVLETLIQETILLNAAKLKGINYSQDEFDKVYVSIADTEVFKQLPLDRSLWKKRLKRRLLIQKLIDQELTENIAIDPQDIRSYYEAHTKEFRQAAQFRARQILVDSKELADDIKKRIKDGEDFAKLAKEYSLSPDRERGGDLGFFDAAIFPPVFSEICSRLKKDEISEVVATDYGYQIFQLLDKRAPRQLSFEEAQEKIKLDMQEEKKEKAFEVWFKGLRDSAQVAINQSALEKIDVFQD